MAVIETRLQGGHTEMVLTVAVMEPPSVRIISGAECGELAIWSLDGINLQKHTIVDRDDITSIVCSRLNPDVFYAASGEKIYSFDARQLDQPIDRFHFNKEEINQIALNEKEKFLAAADDTGNINVINLQEKRLYKILKKHTNICATVSFRPRRPWDLVSGGYDNRLIQWDFSKSHSYCNIDMQELGGVPEDVDSYVVSPPFVHNVSISASGNLMACGTENASVYIFDSSNKTVRFKKLLLGHSQGVSQVHFPRFVDDRYLISGGNDGRICIWDLDRELDHGTALVNGCSGNGHGSNAAGPSEGSRYDIEHADKINWLTSGSTADDNKFIVVADSTTCPVLFQFPF